MINRHSRTLNAATRRSRFSLVELLVVITIIFILAALLLPALQRARYSVKEKVCLNNQHQIYVAMAFYADENDDFAPIGHGTGGRTQNNYYVVAVGGWHIWGLLYKQYYFDAAKTWFCPLQRLPLLSHDTPANPWPPKMPGVDQRTGFSVRPRAEWWTGVGDGNPWLVNEADRGDLFLSELAELAIFADSVSRKNAVLMSHEDRANATYGDGAARSLSLDPVMTNVLLLPDIYDNAPSTTSNHLAIWNHMDAMR